MGGSREASHARAVSSDQACAAAFENVAMDRFL